VHPIAVAPVAPMVRFWAWAGFDSVIRDKEKPAAELSYRDRFRMDRRSHDSIEFNMNSWTSACERPARFGTLNE
jgi:hypothetical protein